MAYGIVGGLSSQDITTPVQIPGLEPRRSPLILLCAFAPSWPTLATRSRALPFVVVVSVVFVDIAALQLLYSLLLIL